MGLLRKRQNIKYIVSSGGHNNPLKFVCMYVCGVYIFACVFWEWGPIIISILQISTCSLVM